MHEMVSYRVAAPYQRDHVRLGLEGRAVIAAGGEAKGDRVRQYGLNLFLKSRLLDALDH